jgi:hypothetical protein
MQARRFNFVFIFTIFVALISACDQRTKPASTIASYTDTALKAFVVRRSELSWNDLVTASSRDPASYSARLVSLVQKYNEAELNRDLPNSMARTGTPDEAVFKANESISQTLAALKSISDEDLWQLLTALVQQDFDDSYQYSAAELAFRIYPERYDELMKSCGAAKGEMLAQIKERWNTALIGAN